MPVILRMRNLSTDLKITNGAQGFIRKLSLAVTPQGLMYCSCAIVEFPDSPVKLEGLPQGFFPITPVTFSFTASFIREADSKIEKKKIFASSAPNSTWICGYWTVSTRQDTPESGRTSA